MVPEWVCASIEFFIIFYIVFHEVFIYLYIYIYICNENDGVPLPLLHVRIAQGFVHTGKGFLLLVLECIKTKTQVERQSAIIVHWKSSSQDYLNNSVDSAVKSVVNRVDSAIT